MEQYRFPIRVDNPITLEYTYRKPPPSRDRIDLSGSTVVKLVIKRTGDTVTEVDADFGSGIGDVVCVDYQFADAGEWSAQFKVTLASSNPLWGELIRFKVVVNTDELTADQLPDY